MGFCKELHTFTRLLSVNNFRKIWARSSPEMVNTRAAGPRRELNELGEAGKAA